MIVFALMNQLFIKMFIIILSQYDIYGHSGETFAEVLVTTDKPPKNNRDRLNVLKVRLSTTEID